MIPQTELEKPFTPKFRKGDTIVATSDVAPFLEIFSTYTALGDSYLAGQHELVVVDSERGYSSFHVSHFDDRTAGQINADRIKREAEKKQNASKRFCPIIDEVRKDLLDRSERGLEKYGVTLDRNDLNLEDWLNHAYEETLDKAAYLKKAIKEVQKIKKAL
jgi:hypothetical protein